MYDTTDGITIGNHLTMLDRAQATFEREKAALYRADGRPKFSDVEHEQRLKAASAALDAVVSAAQEVAQGIITTQQTLVQHFEQGDVLDALNSVEQQNASARRAFIAEDCQTLSPGDLMARCRAALAGGDKATMFLLGRYLGQRVAAADRAALAGQKAELTAQQRQELGQLVEELQQRVRGSAGEQRAEQAKALLERAQELRRRSIAVHDAAHGSAVDRERERLLATGHYGAGPRR
jgi:hypothetical protein